jgi:hypothetical protein
VTGTDEHRDVYILGAGFSYAVHPGMPLADRLGRAAFDLARKEDPNWFRGVAPPRQRYPFEIWLSTLADAQPYLDEAGNRANAARFHRLSDSLAKELSDRLDVALAADAPCWLYDLLSLFHETRADVLTLNYDNLIEAGVNTMNLTVHESDRLKVIPTRTHFGNSYRQARVAPTDLLGGQPLMAPGTEDVERPLLDTMRLSKLHGSLGWWWVPRDLTGSTLARERFDATFSSAEPAECYERSAILPGREPFIVPPLATKSPYFTNPVTRQMWQDAHDALSAATRVVLMGYSLPLTDTVVVGMLRSALAASKASVQVVDLRPRSVCSRLRALGASISETFPGEHCVQDFVRTECDRRNVAVTRAIAGIKDLLAHPWNADLVKVTWSSAHERDLTVNDCVLNNGIVSLTTQAGFVADADIRVQPQHIIDACSRAERLIVTEPNGASAPVVGFRLVNFDSRNDRHILDVVAAGHLSAPAG